MKCANCGYENKDDARFCVACGQKLEDSHDVKAPIPGSEDGGCFQGIKEEEFFEEGPVCYEMNPKHASYKKIPLIFGAAVIAVAVAAIWGSGMGQDVVYAMQYRKQISLGEKYMEEEDYEAAALAYNKAMQIDPYKSDSYVGLADAYLKQGQEEQAEEVIEQARDHGVTQIEEKVEERNEKTDVAADESKGSVTAPSEAPEENVAGSETESGRTEESEKAAETETETETETEKVQASQTETGTEGPTEAAPVINWAVGPTQEFYDMEPVLSFTPDAPRVAEATSEWMGLTLFCQEPENEKKEPEEEKYGLIDQDGKMLAEAGTVKRGSSGLLILGKTDADGQSVANAPDGQPMDETAYTPSYYILETKTKSEGFDDGRAGAILAYAKAGDEKAAGVVIFDGKGSRINDEIYDDGYQLSDGLIVLSKDGKWGAVDITGKTVIPFEYDDAAYTHNGATPVCKDGKWGYVDRRGAAMTSFVFEKALPAYKGRAWVKYEGKWGVFILDDAEEEPEPETKAEETESASQTETALPETESAPQTETVLTETESAPQTENTLTETKNAPQTEAAQTETTLPETEGIQAETPLSESETAPET